MPHMSNLPWMMMYCSIFGSVLFLCTAYNPCLYLNMQMTTNKNNKKNNTLWLW